MNELPLPPHDGGGRFPGMDVLAESDHWDRATSSVVGARLGLLPEVRFFTPDQEATATALLDRLLDQREPPRVPLVKMVDARLAERQTDGWHYDTLPADGEAWRQSLAALDSDAAEQFGTTFAGCSWDEQAVILQDVQARGTHDWHGFPGRRIWSLWTRYACTAFYSHPWSWNEIGFAGPAYPRGYKNLGVDRLEPFEVHDARPDDNPAARIRDNPALGSGDSPAGRPSENWAARSSASAQPPADPAKRQRAPDRQQADAGPGAKARQEDRP